VTVASLLLTGQGARGLAEAHTAMTSVAPSLFSSSFRFCRGSVYDPDPDPDPTMLAPFDALDSVMEKTPSSSAPDTDTLCSVYEEDVDLKRRCIIPSSEVVLPLESKDHGKLRQSVSTSLQLAMSRCLCNGSFALSSTEKALYARYYSALPPIFPGHDFEAFCQLPEDVRRCSVTDLPSPDRTTLLTVAFLVNMSTAKESSAASSSVPLWSLPNVDDEFGKFPIAYRASFDILPPFHEIVSKCSQLPEGLRTLWDLHKPFPMLHPLTVNNSIELPPLPVVSATSLCIGVSSDSLVGRPSLLRAFIVNPSNGSRKDVSSIERDPVRFYFDIKQKARTMSPSVKPHYKAKRNYHLHLLEMEFQVGKMLQTEFRLFWYSTFAKRKRRE